jgi:prevent-host-death family protein
MTRVSVSELKAQLSRYLQEVRRGGEVEILDRGVPVARLTALPHLNGGGEERRERLVRAGVLRPGRGGSSTILDLPPLELSAGIVEALDEDREDRF